MFVVRYKPAKLALSVSAEKYAIEKFKSDKLSNSKSFRQTLINISVTSNRILMKFLNLLSNETTINLKFEKYYKLSILESLKVLIIMPDFFIIY